METIYEIKHINNKDNLNSNETFLKYFNHYNK